MAKGSMSAAGGALFLTALGTASQILGFFHRAVLSRLVGAEVMGLYQLIMPVYSVLLSLTAVGLTAAVSNLTARYLALNDRGGAGVTLSLCLRLFFLVLIPVGVVVTAASDPISVHLLGDARTRLGLILLVPCTALTGVENMHKHAFYGAGLVRPPAVVELMEQLVRTAAVLGLLLLFLPQYPERAVALIVGGMVICEAFSSCTLMLLHRSRFGRPVSGGPGPQGCRRRAVDIAIPVGLNALLGNLLGAANTALIPRMLVRGGMAPADAVSALGVVNGMTLPLLALPTVYLGAINLILSPRLARAHTLGREKQLQRLLDRAIEAVALLTFPSMAMMVVLGPRLGSLIFHQPSVGTHLLPLAAAMAASCFCSVLAAALNSVGRQRTVALISLLGGVVQLLCTLALVPAVGMGGYVAGTLLSAALELAALLLQACRHTGLSPQPFRWLTAPGLSALLAGLSGRLLLLRLTELNLPFSAAGPAAAIFGLLLYLAGLYAQGLLPGGTLSRG